MKESVYRRCLVHALRQDGFIVDVERRLDIEFEGMRLGGALRMDIVVNNMIVFEVKAADVPLDVWDAQVLSFFGIPSRPPSAPRLEAIHQFPRSLSVLCVLVVLSDTGRKRRERERAGSAATPEALN